MKSRRHPWTAAGDRSPAGHVMASQITSHPIAGHTLTRASDTTARRPLRYALRAPLRGHRLANPQTDRQTGVKLHSQITASKNPGAAHYTRPNSPGNWDATRAESVADLHRRMPLVPLSARTRCC